MTTTPRDILRESATARSEVIQCELGNAAVACEARFTARAGGIVAAAATSCSSHHLENEDSHSALDGPAPLFVVADGVGGGALAAWASRELVAQLHATLDKPATDPKTVQTALVEADRAIGRRIVSLGYAGGAATVALCKGLDVALSRWLVAWVGDCRVYRLNGERRTAELLTRDDSYRHLDEPPPRGASPDDPARMVGNGAVTTPNIRDVELVRGDVLVLCSDGVHKHATAADIQRLIFAADPLARGCERLIDLAREHGSCDDATVLAIRRLRQDHVQTREST